MMSKLTRDFIIEVKEHFESMPMLTDAEEHILDTANELLDHQDEN